MAIWVALLRGVNVGGNNPLPMKVFAQDLEAVGCTSVTTYIQSGNVVFKNSKSKAPQLSKRIGQVIADRHGFKPSVLVLPASDIKAAAAANPFPDATADPKSLHLTFLWQKPAPANIRSLDSVKDDSESCSIKGKVLYLHAPNGVARSKIAAKAERLLGVSGTSRNWRTVTKILDLIEQTK